MSESDPVVIIIVQSTILKTRVVNDDANPVYNEQFVFDYDPKQNSTDIKLRLFDDDTIGDSDFLGQVSIGIEEFLNKLKLRRLRFMSDKNELVAEGEFEFLYDAPSAPNYDPSLSASFSEAKSGISTYLPPRDAEPWRPAPASKVHSSTKHMPKSHTFVPHYMSIRH
ncbi:MAG: hypothetical protein EZS28_026713 [Streblomastix strix]|uniref:C2 domain-containing protein n=1 Tax=Streblomastix strix TaxID=222440 RepID=A0A5J4V4S3_9EUKA|nr:MAG: hypothetical protein EZS28_026713 [Streblomastix strix]